MINLTKHIFSGCTGHYNYDIHGNVNTLLQDNKKLVTEVPDLASQQFKKMDYSYDLISGNVHCVSYQKDSADVWHHAYEYDADNRITDVYTSNFVGAEDLSPSGGGGAAGGGLWDHDAKYLYYAHGPLARVETGDLQVQGTDYAYTLQGWIKGINSNTLDTLRDIGKDGWRDDDNLNKNFPKDVYGYSLNYFEGDYNPIDNSITGTSHFLADLRDGSGDKSDILQNRHDLFNGNIGAMVTTITNPTNRTVLPLGNAYKYDQLNRLIEARSFDNYDIANNRWDSSGVAYDNMYFNRFSYDANGNILSQVRFDESSTAIDSLLYQYAKNSDSKTIQNRLYHVNDDISDTRFTDDIDDMGTFDSDLADINTNNNYSYSAIGELEKDAQEEILAIEWRVDGKVKEVYRTAASSKKNLKFDYDAMGNRVGKHIFSSDSVWEKSTYYARDAQGNVMSVYEYTFDDVAMEVSYKDIEQHIYGSSRLGMRTDSIEMIAATVDTTYYERTLGKKQYEFSNHLGNVLTVISDKKLPLDWDSDDTTDSYHAEIIMASDYSPFGVTLSGRDFVREICQADTVTSLNTDFNDGTTQGYSATNATLSNVSNALRIAKTGIAFVFGANKTFSVIAGESYTITADVNMGTCSGTISIAIKDENGSGVTSTTSGTGSVSLSFTATTDTLYQIAFNKNGGGSCYFTIDNVLITYIDTVCNNQNYRYGFQGQERDDEMKGAGNSVNFTFRMHDPRLGRFFAVDPMCRIYPYNSTYAFSENRVIDHLEMEGLEKTTYIKEVNENTGTTVFHIKTDKNAKKSVEFVVKTVHKQEFDWGKGTFKPLVTTEDKKVSANTEMDAIQTDPTIVSEFYFDVRFLAKLLSDGKKESATGGIVLDNAKSGKNGPIIEYSKKPWGSIDLDDIDDIGDAVGTGGGKGPGTKPKKVDKPEFSTSDDVAEEDKDDGKKKIKPYTGSMLDSVPVETESDGKQFIMHKDTAEKYKYWPYAAKNGGWREVKSASTFKKIYDESKTKNGKK